MAFNSWFSLTTLSTEFFGTVISLNSFSTMSSYPTEMKADCISFRNSDKLLMLVDIFSNVLLDGFYLVVSLTGVIETFFLRIRLFFVALAMLPAIF